MSSKFLKRTLQILLRKPDENIFCHTARRFWVGRFVDAKFPLTAGKYRYEPYRSGSHYRVGQLVLSRRPEYCFYVTADQATHYFKVLNIERDTEPNSIHNIIEVTGVKFSLPGWAVPFGFVIGIARQVFDNVREFSSELKTAIANRSGTPK